MSIDKENEKHLMDHEYDGIQECDYPLPNWWIVTFVVTAIIGAVYLYHMNYGSGVSIRDKFKAEAPRVREIQESYLEKIGELDLERYQKISSRQEMLELGRAAFNANCVACHAQNAAGLIGPNLTDQYWLYAEGTPETIYPFIVTGNPGGGMPSWGDKLSVEEIYSLTAYIMSIQGISHEKPKAPQGEYFGEKKDHDAKEGES